MLHPSFFAAALAATLLWVTAPAANAVIAVEDFARHAEFENIKISPDGRHFAATVPIDDTTVLVLIERENMNSGTILKPGRDQHVYWFEWANDDRILYQVERKRGGYDFPQRYGEIFASDVNGDKHGSIFGYKSEHQETGTRLRINAAERAWGEVIDMLPDDPDHVLIMSRPWTVERNSVSEIFRLDINRGLKKREGRLPLRDPLVLTDDNNKPRMVSGYARGFEWAVQYRSGTAKDWIDVPVLSDVQFQPISFSNDGARVFGLGRDANTVLGLFEYSVGDGVINPVISGSPFDISFPLLVPRTRELFGVYSSAEKLHYGFIDDDHVMARVYKSLLEAFPEQQVLVTSTTRDGSEMIVRVSNDRNPGDFFIFDRDKKDAKYLLSQRAWLDPELMAHVEPVKFAARDGVTLHGYVTYPSDGSGKKDLPMVVMPHGGPHGPRDTWSFDAEAQFLASRGYAVLQPNFRGSGGYGMDFEESGYREWGGKMQDDVTDATLWAIEKGIADADRICIYGASYGGYAALMGVVREPALYRCAIGSAGVYDLQLMYERGDIKDWIPGRGYLEKVITNEPDLLWKRSPVNHVDKIKTPVMLVHGGRDERVPIKHAKAMRRALKKSGNEPVWLTFRYEAHGYYSIKNRVRLFNEVEGFLRAHIGP